MYFIVVTFLTGSGVSCVFDGLTLICPRVQTRCGPNTLSCYLGADGTHLAEARPDGPGVKSPSGWLFFPVTRSGQKVGDDFIWTAAELLNSRGSR